MLNYYDNSKYCYNEYKLLYHDAHKANQIEV